MELFKRLKNMYLGKKWVGKKYGRLTVKEVLENRRVLCECECGKEVRVFKTNLVTENTTSCGCANFIKNTHRNTRHGLSKTKTYHAWANMKSACNNPKSRPYRYVGAKDITYCDRWERFENFLIDMGQSPSDTRLSRKDATKDFAKENCYWKEVSRTGL